MSHAQEDRGSSELHSGLHGRDRSSLRILIDLGSRRRRTLENFRQQRYSAPAWVIAFGNSVSFALTTRLA